MKIELCSDIFRQKKPLPQQQKQQQQQQHQNPNKRSIQ